MFCCFYAKLFLNRVLWIPFSSDSITCLNTTESACRLGQPLLPYLGNLARLVMHTLDYAGESCFKKFPKGQCLEKMLVSMFASAWHSSFFYRQPPKLTSCGRFCFNMFVISEAGFVHPFRLMLDESLMTWQKRSPLIITFLSMHTSMPNLIPYVLEFQLFTYCITLF